MLTLARRPGSSVAAVARRVSASGPREVLGQILLVQGAMDRWALGEVLGEVVAELASGTPVAQDQEAWGQGS